MPAPILKLTYVEVFRRDNRFHVHISLRKGARERFIADPDTAKYGYHIDRRGRIRKTLGKVGLETARGIAKDQDTIAERADKQESIDNWVKANFPSQRTACKTLAELFTYKKDEEQKRVDAGTLERRTRQGNEDFREQLRRYLQHCALAESILLSQFDHQLAAGLKLWFLSAQGYAPSTWNQLLHHLSGVWRQAMKFRWTDSNPWDDSDLHEEEGEAKHAPPLTVEQAHKLYAAPMTETITALKFMLMTGARVSDVVGIHLTEIDLVKRVIWCRQPKLRHKKRQVKPLIITDELLPIVNWLMARARGGLLFSRADGSACDRKYCAQLWNGHLKKILDNKLVGTKSCRVNFETKLGDVGIPQQIIDELMGHSSGHAREHYIAARELQTLRQAAQTGVRQGIFGGQDPRISHVQMPFVLDEPIAIAKTQPFPSP
ncbi:MAG: tyrosine-type recombinase/integrase [Verrucomicrobiia bacterium]